MHRLSLMIAACLAACLFAGGAAAAGPDDGERDRVLALVRSGDGRAAAAVRSWVEAHPGDTLMLYNLACLEARDGRTGAALAALEQAKAGGFDDLDTMAGDPDLASLRGVPAYADLAASLAAMLQARAAASGADLLPGQPVDLALAGPDGSGSTATIGWEADALVLEFPGEPKWLSDRQSRPRLLVTLGGVDGAAPWRRDDGVVIACGADGKGAFWGALWLAGPDRWQTVAELQPTLVEDGGEPRMAVRVPWQLIQPLHPLTEPLLGLNIARLDPPQGEPGFGEPRVLVSDPQLFVPGAANRRVAHLRPAADRWPARALVGRLDDSIVRGDSVAIDLVIVTPTAGTGRLVIDFFDNQGRSLLAGGPLQGTLPLAAGRQVVTRRASFAGLRTAWIRLQADVEFPDGESAVWSTNLLNLEPGWDDSLSARGRGLDDLDRIAADHFLAAARAAVAAHVPRRNPGPIAKTLGDLNAMLDRAEAHGSAWARGEPGLVAYRGPDGERLCSIYQPERSLDKGPVTPVVVVTSARGDEEAFCRRLDRYYRHGDMNGAGDDRPVYIIPHLPTVRRPAEVRAAIDFARQRFAAESVWLAGADAGAGPALEAAAGGDGAIGRLAVFAGSRLEPWPMADADFLADRLAGLPAGLPVDWTDFTPVSAKGQGPALLQVLQDRGQALTVRRASGEASLTQCADRTLLWAEGMPVPGGE
jgi:hypothetical protein